jgi:hypothetical protein
MVEQTAGEYESGLLSDGELTFTEYEASALELVNCAEQLGYGIAGSFEPTVRGEYVLTFVESPAATPTSLSSMHSSLQECNQTYFNLVNLFWSRHTAPSESELQAARDELAACLRGGGFTLPEHPAAGEIRRTVLPPGQPAPAIIVQCQQRIMDHFGLPGFIG